jgi:hypothetical protein
MARYDHDAEDTKRSCAQDSGQPVDGSSIHADLLARTLGTTWGKVSPDLLFPQFSDLGMTLSTVDKFFVRDERRGAIGVSPPDPVFGSSLRCD